jgi:hypothetical protein
VSWWDPLEGISDTDKAYPPALEACDFVHPKGCTSNVLCTIVLGYRTGDWGMAARAPIATCCRSLPLPHPLLCLRWFAGTFVSLGDALGTVPTAAGAVPLHGLHEANELEAARAFLRSDRLAWPTAPAATLNNCWAPGAAANEIWLDVHQGHLGGVAANTPQAICREIHEAGWTHAACDVGNGAPACRQCALAVAAGAPDLGRAGFAMGSKHVGIEAWGAARWGGAVPTIRDVEWEPGAGNLDSVGLTEVERLKPGGGWGAAWTVAELNHLLPHNGPGPHPFAGYNELFVPVPSTYMAEGTHTQTPLGRSVVAGAQLLQYAHPSPFFASKMARALRLVHGAASARVQGLSEGAAVAALAGVESATVAAPGGAARCQPDLELMNVRCTVDGVTQARSVAERDANGQLQPLRVRVEDGGMYCPHGERRCFLHRVERCADPPSRPQRDASFQLSRLHTRCSTYVSSRVRAARACIAESPGPTLPSCTSAARRDWRRRARTSTCVPMPHAQLHRRALACAALCDAGPAGSSLCSAPFDRGLVGAPVHAWRVHMAWLPPFAASSAQSAGTQIHVVGAVAVGRAERHASVADQESRLVHRLCASWPMNCRTRVT